MTARSNNLLGVSAPFRRWHGVGLAVIMAVGVGLGASWSAEPAAGEIEQLIQQLGSDKFTERERATQRLLALGESALVPLRKAAATSADPEVLSRAKTLIQAIGRGLELRCFQGHGGLVTCVAYSSNGRHVLSGSLDQTLRLWDVDTGKELRRFEGHTKAVWSVAFSPDGKLALSGGHDGKLRMWETGIGKELHCFTEHKDGHVVASVAFSPDGRRALSGCWDRTVRLWDVTNKQAVQTFDVQTPVLRVQFAPDGRRALLGGQDGTVRLWELDTAKELRRFEGHRSPVWAVAFSPDGRHALTGSGGDFFMQKTPGMDRSVRLWEVETGKEVRRFEGHTDTIRSVTFSPDGRQVLTGSLDGTVGLWEAASGREVHRFLGHGGGVECVVFSPDGQRILSASFDKSVRLWRLPGAVKVPLGK